MPSRQASWLSLARGTVLLLLILAASPGPPAGVVPALDLSGRVSDVLGNRVSDAEVLMVSTAVSGGPVASARSDAAGLFRISGLLPGVYRVAAVKGGYLTFLGQVNTRVDRWLDVILQPAAAAAADTDTVLPQDSTWSLRLPRRSLLRETAPDASGGRAAEGEGAPRESIADAALHVEVEQLFALQRGLRPESGAAPGGQGTRTRLKAGSTVGQRGRVLFEGVRESFDASRAEEAGVASTNRGATGIAVDFFYDASPDDRVAVNAFYSQRDLQLVSGVPDDGSDAVLQAQRSWGYDAEWSRQIDAASSLAVKLDYVESKLELPEGLPEEDAPTPGDPVTAVSNRSVGAAGTYESLPIDDHQVQVDFRARLVDAPYPALQAAAGGLSAEPLRGVAGWSVGLDARDTWRVSGPFAIVYGLGYKHSLASQDIALIVPRLGASWSSDDLVMRFLVSYHQVQSWGEVEAGGAPPPYRPVRQVGYEAQLELPLGGGVRLSATTRSSPIQFDAVDGTRGSAEGDFQPVYVTDGNAAVDEDRLSLIREGAGIRTYVELVDGEVTGLLAPVLPFDVPFRWLSESRLRYRNTRLGVRVAASGTDLLLDYRKVREPSANLDSAEGDFLQESVELRVAQDLLRLRSLGSWRLLLALRMASLEGGGADQWVWMNRAQALNTPNRELSAGLSVLF